MARADVGSLPGAPFPDQVETGLHRRFRRALNCLTDGDSRRFAALADARSFEQGAVIAEAGPGRHALCLLTSGSACMMRVEAGHDVAIAHFVPGALVGGFSYIEHNLADARICAFEPVNARIVGEPALNLLLTADTGLSERFYRSLDRYVCPSGAANEDEMRTRWSAYRQSRARQRFNAGFPPVRL